MKAVKYIAMIFFCMGLFVLPGAHAVETFDAALQCRSVSADTCLLSQALGRGINMGNMLEAPREGDWGVKLEPRFIDTSSTVFTTVRVPVRWTNHAAPTADATIDPTFLARVDSVVDAFLAKGMYVILDLHHYNQIFGDALAPNEFAVDPSVVNTRLIAIWKQLGEHYKNRSPKLIFELLNEPHGQLTSTIWNQLMPQVLAAVRQSNPTRTVFVASTYWSGVRDLGLLSMPPGDRNLIMMFHNYDPMNFTHQGISWMPQYPAGTTCCNAAQQKIITDALDKAKQWSLSTGYPIYLGEFGSFQSADMNSRANYTRFVRDEAEKRGINWAYWEFASSFGVFDPTANAWREPLRHALLD